MFGKTLRGRLPVWGLFLLIPHLPRTTPISKSMPMNPDKKNSSGFGSPDNQSLTF